MSKYKMQDDTIVDTTNAKESWQEASDWNGSNQISRATGTQWSHETLYESAKGRFYVEHTGDHQGVLGYAEWVSLPAAAAWLLYNDHPLPEGLVHLEAEISE